MVLPIWLIIGQAIKQSISNQESVACHDEGNNGSLLIKGHLLARESKLKHSRQSTSGQEHHISSFCHQAMSKEPL